LGRVMAEMNQSQVNLEQWNTVSEDAILHVLFG